MRVGGVEEKRDNVGGRDGIKGKHRHAQGG